MKLLIVGGVVGGASAAARAHRLSEEAHIILFERGPDVPFATGLPGDPHSAAGRVPGGESRRWVQDVPAL
jgi:NADPH-dependent 2,4-dienoyl-CoA reductase/sulfur reductase-like enzyme